MCGEEREDWKQVATSVTTSHVLFSKTRNIEVSSWEILVVFTKDIRTIEIFLSRPKPRVICTVEGFITNTSLFRGIFNIDRL